MSIKCHLIIYVDIFVSTKKKKKKIKKKKKKKKNTLSRLAVSSVQLIVEVSVPLIPNFSFFTNNY